MLLQQLSLENIRSYEKETVIFPEGSTLLSGDIGSGKSSLLLAIEFALFGSSRSNLSAEALLRKGSTKAQVELHFLLAEKEVVVRRGLKKTARGIQQTAGEVVVNGVKKELTPVEIKAELLSLLGYPEELVSKGKNYLFRYTVYCPQEEMKLILQENAEQRLEILRKIFNIDKYSIVRENLYPYLREIRKELTVLETKVEPIQSLQEKISILQKEREALRVGLEQLSLKKKPVEERRERVKKKLLVLEEKEKKKVVLENEIKQSSSLLKELSSQETSLSEKQKGLMLFLNELLLSEELSKEGVLLEVKDLEEKKEGFLRRRMELEKQISLCQERISFLQGELKEQNFSKEQVELLKRRIKEQEGALLGREELEKELERLLNLERENSEFFQKTKTLLEASSQLLERILHLDQCPTCLQEVDSLYKEGIRKREGERSSELGKELEQLESQRREILSKKEGTSKKKKNLEEIEKASLKYGMELRSLQEKEQRALDLRRALQEEAKKNNVLVRSLEEFLRDSSLQLERINLRLSQLESLRDKVLRKEEKEKDLKNCEAELQGVLVRKKELLLKEEEMKGKLKVLMEESLAFGSGSEGGRIEDLRKELELVVEEEKTLSLEEARMKTSSFHFQEQEVALKKELSLLFDLEKNLLQRKEMYSWLNDFFLQLTYTIEKELMLRIYHHFNQLFQEWFSLLVEDNQLYARLDEQFTPVVEQAGHSISFAHLSGGERTAVSLAYRLALNKVINDVVGEIQTKDLLILDEPTDGFSSEQLEKMHDLIDHLGLAQILIVSHEPKVESFVDNVVRVVKEESGSRVV